MTQLQALLFGAAPLRHKKQLLDLLFCIFEFFFKPGKLAIFGFDSTSGSQVLKIKDRSGAKELEHRSGAGAEESNTKGVET